MFDANSRLVLGAPVYVACTKGAQAKRTHRQRELRRAFQLVREGVGLALKQTFAIGALSHDRSVPSI